MEVNATCQDRDLVIRLKGELDHHSARDVIDKVEQEIETELPAKLTLDFAGVSFMDSSGLAVAMRCRQRMRELGGGVCISHVPRQPRKVFEASGVTRLITIE